MKTYLDCIPCFFRQALEGSRIIKATPRQQKQIIDGFARRIPGISLKASPPEIARAGYGLLKTACGISDPYRSIKQKSNRCALRMLGKLRAKVARSKNRILTAVELAIAGNIIDFGVKNNLDVKTELKKILAEENRAIRRRSLFHYAEFEKALRKARTILYLADNAGEVVFDRVLAEEITKSLPHTRLYYAVKEKPIINDALKEDAIICGINKVTRVISNGSDAPGTILRLCSGEFKRIYRSADMVISKGQGNFESLSQEKRPIFFLFMVKCPVVARETSCAMGNIVLLHNGTRQWKH